MPNNMSKPFYEQTISNNYNLNNIINKIKINEKISYQEIKSLIKKILGRYYFRYLNNKIKIDYIEVQSKLSFINNNLFNNIDNMKSKEELTRLKIEWNNQYNEIIYQFGLAIFIKYFIYRKKCNLNQQLTIKLLNDIFDYNQYISIKELLINFYQTILNQNLSFSKVKDKNYRRILDGRSK